MYCIYLAELLEFTLKARNQLLSIVHNLEVGSLGKPFQMFLSKLPLQRSQLMLVSRVRCSRHVLPGGGPRVDTGCAGVPLVKLVRVAGEREVWVSQFRLNPCDPPLNGKKMNGWKDWWMLLKQTLDH